MFDGAAVEYNNIYFHSISVVCDALVGAGCIDSCNPTPVVCGVVVVGFGQGFVGCLTRAIFILILILIIIIIIIFSLIMAYIATISYIIVVIVIIIVVVVGVCRVCVRA